MKILVACEYSGRVRDAFARMGHDAMSCDILPSESPGNHYKGDVKDVVDDDTWGMIVAHPPCTHLSASGARFWKEKKADGRQKQGIDFFMMFANHPCGKVAIENPVGIMSRVYRRPDQYIQPWQYGHNETKKTGLWLKGLPLLEPTEIVTPDFITRKGKQYSPIHFLSGKRDRGKIRSITYHGIANAMAAQWGGL